MTWSSRFSRTTSLIGIIVVATGVLWVADPIVAHLPTYGRLLLYLSCASILVILVEAVDSARRRAKVEKTRLDGVTESTSVLLVQCGRDLRYKFVNRACVEFLGLPREEIVGRPIAEIMGAAAFETIRPFIERVLQGEIVEYEVEVPYERLGPKTVQVRYVPDRDESGDVIGWFASVADVTERARAAEALRTADRHKDDFLATLAHELRNPLAPIRQAAAVLRSSDDPREVAWSRDVIDRQVAHMARLLDDLLDVSRIARDRMDIRPSPIDIASVVAAAIETSRPLLDAGGHELTVDLPSTPIHVNGDPVRLAQVFANLLNNSARYTQPSGHVRIVARKANAHVDVSVADDGIGIAKEALPHLFETFHRSEPARDAHGGLGLGLSLVRGLVDLHGGNVEVHSDGPGQGTTFLVRLPTVAPPPPVLPSETRLPRAITEPRRRIVVVDDNRDSADSLSLLLRLDGHEVATAYDGESALAVISASDPDVVFLDLGLPKLDGFEVCRRLRAQPGGARRRVVAVTGWSQEADRQRSRDAGFDQHLVKPVDLDVLEDVVRGS